MDPERPFAFLVSTPGGASSVATFDALTPALERLGTVRLLANPETSLPFAAAKAEAEGRRAIHLAVGQLHDLYLTPAVPNVLVSLWDYPDLPTVDLARNGRTNAKRVADHLDLILAPTRSVAGAFRRAGVSTPIVLLPIPARAGRADLPTWGPGLPATVCVPHVAWGGIEADETQADEDESPAPTRPATTGLKRRLKGRLRRLKPYLSNATVQRFDAAKGRLAPLLLRPNPARLLGKAARLGYRRLVRRWISDEAHGRLAGLRGAFRRRSSTESVAPSPPSIDPSPLTLSGLVYSAEVDLSDPTTEAAVLLSAAVHAFRDRPDVTLLVRLVTTQDREADDLARLRADYEAIRIEPRCRIVVATVGPDDDSSMAMARGVAYQVETARSRGWPTATAEALASGRPVIGPRHSGLADWVTEDVGIVVRSDPEPAAWPIDPLALPETEGHRVVWSDLRDRLIESAAIADDDPRRYESLSAAARRSMADRAGVEVVAEILADALVGVSSRSPGAFGWED